ncbi:hypothetical protein [Streptomyces sp. AC602_WCS936]|uniref:hypothetical protein n=1 Tax=Streptomyces sp. AC602_WCS936 TaxID=2823685 RepID=UPI001C27831D|nr:hypothetical protein [Streptomyces sp. AC602_WCS936]
MAVLLAVCIPVLMLGVVLAMGRYEELVLPSAAPPPDEADAQARADQWTRQLDGRSAADQWQVSGEAAAGRRRVSGRSAADQ